MTSRGLYSEPWACGGVSGEWYDPVPGSQEKSGLGDCTQNFNQSPYQKLT